MKLSALLRRVTKGTHFAGCDDTARLSPGSGRRFDRAARPWAHLENKGKTTMTFVPRASVRLMRNETDARLGAFQASSYEQLGSPRHGKYGNAVRAESSTASTREWAMVHVQRAPSTRNVTRTNATSRHTRRARPPSPRSGLKHGATSETNFLPSAQ